MTQVQDLNCLPRNKIVGKMFMSVVFQYIDRYKVALNENDKIFQCLSLTHSYKVTVTIYICISIYIQKLALFIFVISMVYTPKYICALVWSVTREQLRSKCLLRETFWESKV